MYPAINFKGENNLWLVPTWCFIWGVKVWISNNLLISLVQQLYKPKWLYYGVRFPVSFLFSCKSLENLSTHQFSSSLAKKYLMSIWQVCSLYSPFRISVNKLAHSCLCISGWINQILYYVNTNTDPLVLQMYLIGCAIFLIICFRFLNKASAIIV